MEEAMTEKELKDSVKAPEGTYFFYGEEDYLKDHYIKQIRRAVITDESLADFNEFVFDDMSFSLAAFEDALTALPLMTDKKLVVVKLSEYSKAEEEDADRLYELIGELAEDTVLVISVVSGGFDAGPKKAPSAPLKALSAMRHVKCVDFPLSQEPKLIRWLARHFSERGVASDERSLALMIELCGKGMHRLSLEADKVASRALSQGMATIDPAFVRSTVTVTVEEEAFQLTNSIIEGNTDAALESVAAAKRRNESPVRVLASVTATFCDLAVVAHLAAEGADKKEIAAITKIHEFRVGLYLKAAAGVPLSVIDDAVAMCVETDAKMKSASLGYAPLERLICSVKLR